MVSPGPDGKEGPDCEGLLEGPGREGPDPPEPDRKENSDLEGLLEGPGRQGVVSPGPDGRRAQTVKDYWKHYRMQGPDC